MKRLRERRLTPADHPGNWPPELADHLPNLRRNLLPLKDFVASGFTGIYHGGGEALGAWRLRRRLNRNGQQA